MTFWTSGYEQSLINWLEANAFPKFEEEHGVTIEVRNIGWGKGREEALGEIALLEQ